MEESQSQNEYGLVSLLIGVNNQYQHKSVESYAPEFEELLKQPLLWQEGNGRMFFVVSIPDYGLLHLVSRDRKKYQKG